MSTTVLTRPRPAPAPESLETQKLIGRVSARAMFDEEFKSELVADPRQVLGEQGLEMPEDMTVTVVTSFDAVPADHPPTAMYLVIPDAHDMTEEDLTMAPLAAQSCQSTASTACTTPSCASSASTASTQSCS